MAAVHIVGSINRDIVAYVEHLPRPGETVIGLRSASFPGGKGANQAVAAARMGARVHLQGRVGADALGKEMTAFLAGEGIDVGGVRIADGAATGLALITVDAASQNVIAVVPGANLVWSQGLGPFQPARGDVVVCQLEVPVDIVSATFVEAHAAGAVTILNPAPWQPLPAALLHLVDVLVVNEIEMSGITGEPVEAIEDRALPAVARALLDRGPHSVIVTLGKAGALVVERDRRALRVPGRPVRAIDTTGAGDCFVGALAAMLAAGEDLGAAADIANRAAAISVTREGAASSMPRRDDVTV
jgi:ribokinase